MSKLSTTKTQREYYNRNRQLTCERLSITQNQYNQFRRIGQSLHKIYEMECNGEFGNEFAYEEAVRDYYKAGDNLSKKLGLYIFYQTDPRGATIYLSKEPIADNSYSSTAQCIY